MPSIDLLIPFVLAAAVFAYIPGPAMLYAAAQTMARGRRAGWIAAMGIHLGGYVHVAASTVGLAALLEAVPVLYTAIKFAGAAYLVWLGARMILAPGAASDLPDVSFRSPRRALAESMTVEVLNPKTALFYLAFLPQFTDSLASLPVWTQLAVLGVIVNAMFTSADILAVLMSAWTMRLVRGSRRVSRLIQAIGGGILIGLGLKLAFDRR